MTDERAGQPLLFRVFEACNLLNVELGGIPKATASLENLAQMLYIYTKGGKLCILQQKSINVPKKSCFIYDFFIQRV